VTKTTQEKVHKDIIKKINPSEKRKCKTINVRREFLAEYRLADKFYDLLIKHLSEVDAR
jgi:hypothetical protein